MRPPGRTLPKATDNNDMYSRKFPNGNFLFFFSCKMSLFRLPCSKLPLAFLAVPAGKDGWVECPCQTVDDFIGIRGSVCGLFLFVQTHAPLTVPPWQSRARKSKFQFHIRRKGADAFRPALAAGGWLMAYKCLSLCGLFGFFKGFSNLMLTLRDGEQLGLNVKLYSSRWIIACTAASNSVYSIMSSTLPASSKDDLMGV